MWIHLLCAILLIAPQWVEASDGILRGRTKPPENLQGRKLIVGGSEATNGRFPYMVSIQKFDDMLHSHAGILIAPDIVLTTADTSDYIEDLDEASAAVHTHLLLDPQDESERFPIVRQETHPDFEINEFGFAQHNVRLLKLGGQSSNAWIQLNFDPNEPKEGDTIKLLGWGSLAGGWWRLFWRQYPFESELYELELKYISNEHCIDVSRPYYEANLTENMLCTELALEGYCINDEGGPVIQQGGTTDQDVLVGLIPRPLTVCASPLGFIFRPPLPQLYGRVSDDFDYIRRQVCMLSDAPPPYMQCDPGQFPFPTEMPTASPAPTKATDEVTIVTLYDEDRGQNAWTLFQGEEIIHREFGDSDFVEQTFRLCRGQEYTLEVTDRVGNGMCCKYGNGGVFVMFGAEPNYDKILAFTDGRFDYSANLTFTVSDEDLMTVPQPEFPSLSPSISSAPSVEQLIVTVAIEVGRLPAHLAWRIETRRGYEVVLERPAGTYNSSDVGTVVVDQVSLALGDEYRLRISTNSPGALRQAAVYVGDAIVPGNELVFDSGPFGTWPAYEFVASPSATITITSNPSAAALPSAIPSVSLVPSVSMPPSGMLVPITVEIRLGQFPFTLTWQIRSSTGKTVFEAPNSNYFQEAPGSVVRETLFLSRNSEYEFARDHPSPEDRSDLATAIIYLGSEPLSDRVLFADVAGDTLPEDGKFLVSDDAVFSFTSAPTAVPTTSPTPSPSESMEPSPFYPSVTVVVQYDRYPEEISWSLRTRVGRELASCCGYGRTTAGALIVETVRIRFGRRFVFSIQDSFGDGLCCDYGEGYARLYLGDEVRDDMLLADINPRFGSSFSFDFEPNPNFLIVPTTEPSVAPSTSTPSALPSASVKPSPAPSKSNAPSVSPAPTRRRSAWCFSSMNRVLVEGRGSISMEDVKIGDRVMVGDGRFETVYSFGHYSKKQVAEFIQLTLSNSVSPLELTREHMVFVEDSRAIPAGILKVGDRLMVESGEYGVVRRIEIVERTGVYAPFTASGRIVVNGVVASTFIAFGESWSVEIGSHRIPASYQWLAHAFESPHRMYCRLYMDVCKEERYTDEGVSMWVSGGLEVAEWLMSEGNASWTLLLFPVAATALFVVWAAELFFQCVFCNVMLWICLGACCVWFQHSHRSVLSFKGDRE